MSPVASDPAATACLSPLNCGRLHCAVCTAHLPNLNQRFCSPRCRSRARSLRRERLYCARCGCRQWVRHGEGTS